MAFAILLLGYALQYNDGLYAGPALLLVLAATALTLTAVAWTGTGEPYSLLPGTPGRVGNGTFERLVGPLMGFGGVALAGLASNIVLMGSKWPGERWPIRFPQDHPALLASMLMASLAIALMVWDRRRARTVWFPAAVLAASMMGIWMIWQSPDPRIDVMTVHRYAAASAAGATNPYAMTFPNIYGADHPYAPDMTDGRTVFFGYPYPPLSLLMAFPAEYWCGDFRYAELAALLVGASLIALAPRARLEDVTVGPLAAAFLLFTPRSLFVLEQGWTESFAICWLGAATYAWCRAPRALPWALGLLVSAKQHLVVAVPLALLLLTPRPFMWPTAIRFVRPVLIVPAVFALPFLLWDASSFINSVVLVQLKDPYRADSLSALSALSAAGWSPANHLVLLTLLPGAALALGLMVVSRRADRSMAGFSGALALCLLMVFLVSKKAFCNYYFFVIAALCAAVSASSHQADGQRADHPSAPA